MIDSRDKARLSWHCRRGMLELDLILQHFLNTQVDSFTDSEVEMFDLLLSYTDPELLSWFMGQADPDDLALMPLVLRLREFKTT